MAEACRSHYDSLYAAAGAALAASFADTNGTEMAKSHAFISDYALWIDELRHRPETRVYGSALKEYQFALFALASGQYRAAFSALRLTLELSFAGVHWSSNERELREWLRGQRDSNWTVLSDRDNGVLSKHFVGLFSEELEEEAGGYVGAAVAAYRECSEYVHGNARTQRAVPQALAFDGALFSGWHQRASTVRLVVSFALAARYLGDLDSRARARLECMLLDHLGHSEGVRFYLGATTEAPNV